MEVIIQPDEQTAATLVARIIAADLRRNPAMVLGLATGRTMDLVYCQLTRMHREEGLDFSRCHSFNLDEYVGLSTPFFLAGSIPFQIQISDLGFLSDFGIRTSDSHPSLLHSAFFILPFRLAGGSAAIATLEFAANLMIGIRRSIRIVGGQNF